MEAGGEEEGEGEAEEEEGAGGGRRRRVEEAGEAGVATVMGRLACRNGSSWAEGEEEAGSWWQQSSQRRKVEGMVGGKPLRAQSR